MNKTPEVENIYQVAAAKWGSTAASDLWMAMLVLWCSIYSKVLAAHVHAPDVHWGKYLSLNVLEGSVNVQLVPSTKAWTPRAIPPKISTMSSMWNDFRHFLDHLWWYAHLVGGEKQWQRSRLGDLKEWHENVGAVKIRTSCWWARNAVGLPETGVTPRKLIWCN